MNEAELRELYRTKIKLSEERSKVKQLQQYAADMERATEALSALSKRKPAKPYRLRKKTGSGSKRLAVEIGVFSDWHPEEIVTLESTGGVNEQTLEISEAKIEAIFRNNVKLYKHDSRHYDFQSYEAMFLGDLMTGHIHEENLEMCCMAPLETVQWLYDKIKPGLLLLRQELDCQRINIHWHYGNHGRDRKKPRKSVAAKHNYEWLLGCMLARDTQLQDGFSWNVHESYYSKVYLDTPSGKPLLVIPSHGDRISGGGGVAGIAPAFRRWISATNIQMDEVTFLAIIGHVHHHVDVGHGISNESLIGVTEYEMGATYPPSPIGQRLITVDLEERSYQSRRVYAK